MRDASKPWIGFLSAEVINIIHDFFKRLKRFRYTECSVTSDDLISKSDYELCLPGHSLYHLLPPSHISKLRQRGHSFCCLISTKNRLSNNHSTNSSNFNNTLYLVQYYCITVATTLLYVLCDNVYISLLICICRIIIQGYLLTYHAVVGEIQTRSPVLRSTRRLVSHTDCRLKIAT